MTTLAYPCENTVGRESKTLSNIQGDINNFERSRASLVSLELRSAPECISGGASVIGALTDPPSEKPDPYQTISHLELAVTPDSR